MSGRQRGWIAAVFIALLLAVTAQAPPPSPHGVSGFVYHTESELDQVPAGTPFLVRDIDNNDQIAGTTGAGPFPGRYSVSIGGTDGDNATTTAWNVSSFGRRHFVLQGDMDNQNVYLNQSRPSEMNVTILLPGNHHRVNYSEYFNVSVRIQNIGNELGTSCQAVIMLNNTPALAVALAVGETATHSLGSIGIQAVAFTNFTVNGSRIGNGNITVNSSCSSDVEYFDNTYVDAILNITVEDLIPPNINATPLNGTVEADNNTLFFRYNVSDHSEIQNCSLFINDAFNQSNSTAVKRRPEYNFSVFLPNANYTWYIQCYDILNNSNISGNFSLDVAVPPDFLVQTKDIAIQQSPLIENILLQLNVTIYNTGGADGNATLQFFDGNPDVNGTQIGANQSINISHHSNLSLSTYWSALPGPHELYVVVDPPIATGGNVPEVNENNNVASRNITLVGWQVYFGNVSGVIVLDPISNLSFGRWSAEASNLFVAESGRDIQWTSLEVFGRRTDGGNGANDFDELDGRLNMSAFNDSVNLSYTSGGAIEALKNFTVFWQFKQNVPVINSTNSSAFRTGILWDSSDSSPEFDGSQDVVFVTAVNENVPGRYGSYDFEIQVPVLLRRYLPSGANTLSFYIEMV